MVRSRQIFLLMVPRKKEKGIVSREQPIQKGIQTKVLVMNDDLNIGQWNVRGLRDNNRCHVVRRWVGGLQAPLNALCLQELQTDEERAMFQLGTVFPLG